MQVHLAPARPRAVLSYAVLVLISLLATLTLGGTQTSVAANQTTFSGQATVVKATVLGLPPVVLSDTGPLPAEGGAREASLLQASVPGLLSAEALHAATVGQGNHSRSEASVANLNLTVGGNTIGAGFLMARASASCSGSTPSFSGSSEILALAVNGQTIAVSGQPNQTVNLPVGYIVINEQSSSGKGRHGEITVNALHVVISGVADVIISSAHADIDCAPPAPPCRDFVTGGGQINPPRANFGVAGGSKANGLWGHLTYLDHANGLRVKGTAVTAYLVTGPTTRHIEGLADVNGQGGFNYRVDLADNGEPGRNDSFRLELSNGYVSSGALTGGNIQLHVCK